MLSQVKIVRPVSSTRHSAALDASAAEAAAIVAAMERFMRATAPPATIDTPTTPDGWQAHALLEGVSRDPWATTASDEWLTATPG
jgi:hypothetical protein